MKNCVNKSQVNFPLYLLVVTFFFERNHSKRSSYLPWGSKISFLQQQNLLLKTANFSQIEIQLIVELTKPKVSPLLKPLVVELTTRQNERDERMKRRASERASERISQLTSLSLCSCCNLRVGWWKLAVCDPQVAVCLRLAAVVVAISRAWLASGMFRCVSSKIKRALSQLLSS